MGYHTGMVLVYFSIIILAIISDICIRKFESDLTDNIKIYAH